jgi:hypothetical protein
LTKIVQLVKVSMSQLCHNIYWRMEKFGVRVT